MLTSSYTKAARLALAASTAPIAILLTTPLAAQVTSPSDQTAAPPGPGAANAQPSGDANTAGPGQETIVVTGSRIARPTLDSPIPVTTVSQADLERSGQTNIGDVLQRVPALSASLNQAGSTVNIGTSGLNILNLRNLGAPRTLVLVDGQRHITGEEGEFLVDVNTIPNALIDRVDVVTGGSSAVYGSDAMAGVVNFVLKHNFEGAEINAQGGMSGARRSRPV